MQAHSRTTQTLEGIDVSAYQHVVEWDQVSHAGKRFAAIKATEGDGYQDPQFPRNWARAKLRGITRIAYHFLRPSLDGAAQADYLHAYVRDHGRFEVGDAILLDLEETDGEKPGAVVRCAEAFVQRLLTETVAGIFVYTGPWFWQGVLSSPRSVLLGKCPLWVADYGPSVPSLNNWPSGLTFWQYSDAGHVPGVNGLVDLDRFYGNAATLHQLCLTGGRK